MAKRKPRFTVKYDRQGLPVPLRWAPVFSIFGLVFGVIFDVGVEVLLQQMGIQAMTAWTALRAVLVGLAMGLVFPSLGRAVGVRIVNRRIRSIRRHAGAEATA